MRLYHGTTAEALAEIEASGVLRGPVFLTPDRSVARGYGDGTVVVVSIDEDELLIDCDLPGMQLLTVEDANGYLHNEEERTISDYLEAGQSVGVTRDVTL